MYEDDQKTAVRLAQEVQAQGGQAYFVGGYVRDQLLGIENKDIDIEVHGIRPAQLEEILNSIGECTTMGASFGIFGLRHSDIDIAMPRQEKATGKGHRDFAVFTDPFLGTEKAAMRRDFTVNALMQDVLTGEIIDHFGGQEDLHKGILRHVHADTFVEDPLRVLRAAQFAARFDFTIADETVELCRTMDLRALASERIMGELQKALLKAEKPSVFFETLRTMHQLTVWFPEIENLIGIEQDPRFHPEGDVWTHTMMVLDCAAGLREQAQHPVWFLMAALCHDLGKVRATQHIDGRIRALGHETEGIPLAKALIERLTSEEKLKKYVLNMVELHMRPNIMAQARSKTKAMNKLYDSAICPEDLILLAKADRMGQDRKDSYEEKEAFLKESLKTYREIMARPFVRGADLVQAGFRPGRMFSDALAYAHKLRLAGVEKDSALRQTKAYLRSLEKKGSTE